jgi:hypothetical protein
VVAPTSTADCRLLRELGSPRGAGARDRGTPIDEAQWLVGRQIARENEEYVRRELSYFLTFVSAWRSLGGTARQRIVLVGALFVIGIVGAAASIVLESVLFGMD